MDIDLRIADLRKKAALLRAQAHAMESEAQQLDAARRPNKPGSHTIAPAAGSFVLKSEDE